jgi:hypothetical protein
MDQEISNSCNLVQNRTILHFPVSCLFWQNLYRPKQLPDFRPVRLFQKGDCFLGHRTGHLDPSLKRSGTHAVKPSTYVEVLRIWILDMPEVAYFLPDSVAGFHLFAKAAGWTNRSRCHITENPQSLACLGC